MQARGRFARQVDRIFFTLLLFAGWLLWYVSRVRHLLIALGLALVTTFLLLAALALWLRRAHSAWASKTQAAQRREEALFELTLAEADQALDQVCQALLRVYPLSRPRQAKGLAYATYQGKPIAIGLAQLPDAPTPRDILHMHRKRGKLPAVLVCLRPPTPSAASYAARLRPALSLLDASTLPLEMRGEAGQRAKPGLAYILRQKKNRALHPARAAGYMVIGGLLLLCYLALDSFLYFVPAWVCLFLGIYCHGRKAEPKLFEDNF